jgi:hypothetical protein
MKHIERLLTKDEILEIEKQYSLLQQELAKGGHIGFKTPQQNSVISVIEQNLINKVPHLIAHIKELQSNFSIGNLTVNIDVNQTSLEEVAEKIKEQIKKGGNASV